MFFRFICINAIVLMPGHQLFSQEAQLRACQNVRFRRTFRSNRKEINLTLAGLRNMLGLRRRESDVIVHEPFGTEWLKDENLPRIPMPPLSELVGRPISELLKLWAPAWALRERFSQALFQIAEEEYTHPYNNLPEESAVDILVAVESPQIELLARDTHAMKILSPGSAVIYTVELSGRKKPRVDDRVVIMENPEKVSPPAPPPKKPTSDMDALATPPIRPTAP